MTGVVEGDFTQIFNDLKVTVSHEEATQAVDPMTGQETYTYGDAANLDVIYFENDTRYIYDREGVLEDGDAYIMAPQGTGLKRYSKVTVNGNVYQITQTFLTRRFTGVALFEYGTLKKLS